MGGPYIPAGGYGIIGRAIGNCGGYIGRGKPGNTPGFIPVLRNGCLLEPELDVGVPKPAKLLPSEKLMTGLPELVMGSPVPSRLSWLL